MLPCELVLPLADEEEIAPESLERRRLGPKDLVEHRASPEPVGLEGREGELLLALEKVIEAALAHGRGFANLIDADSGESLSPEKRNRSFDQPAARVTRASHAGGFLTDRLARSQPERAKTAGA